MHRDDAWRSLRGCAQRTQEEDRCPCQPPAERGHHTSGDGELTCCWSITSVRSKIVRLATGDG
ncbi:MAG: hypothetical protein ACK55I_43905, partial [bacterium]